MRVDRFVTAVRFRLCFCTSFSVVICSSHGRYPAPCTYRQRSYRIDSCKRLSLSSVESGSGFRGIQHGQRHSLPIRATRLIGHFHFENIEQVGECAPPGNRLGSESPLVNEELGSSPPMLLANLFESFIFASRE